MGFVFHAQGHPNVRAAHKTTLEFTKAADLTPEGDCIVGVQADFDSSRVRAFARAHKKVKVTMRVGGVEEQVVADTNPDFSDEHELVIRMGSFASPRTFAVNADSAAKYLSRELVKRLQEGARMEVEIEEAVE